MMPPHPSLMTPEVVAFNRIARQVAWRILVGLVLITVTLAWYMTTRMLRIASAFRFPMPRW